LSESTPRIHRFPKKRRWTQIIYVIPLLFAIFLLLAICFPFVLLALSFLQALF